jgi:hypothetical protein
VAALVGKGQVLAARINPQTRLGENRLGERPGETLGLGMLHRTGDAALETAYAALRMDNDGFHYFFPYKGITI